MFLEERVDALEREVIALRKLIGVTLPDSDNSRIEHIKRHVAYAFEMDPSEMNKNHRRSTARVAWPRYIAFYLCHKFCPTINSKTIAIKFGSFDASTARYGLKVCNNRVETEPKFRAKVEQLESEISASLSKHKPVALELAV